MNSVSYKQAAQEGLFSQKKSVDDLIAIAQKKVTRLKTVEDVDAKLGAVNDCGRQVNTCLRQMSDAAKKKAAGRMDDKQFRDTINTASSEIASPVKTVYAKLGNIVESKKNVTSDEIQAFQKYLSGLKRLLADRKKELVNSAKSASESMTVNEDDNMESLLESLNEVLDEAEEACKATESDDECDEDDEECIDSVEDDDDDDEDDEKDDDDDEDEDDEDDDDDEEDSEEESCKCTESFDDSLMSDFSDVCESMINDDFETDFSANSVLNEDGTLNF